MSDIRDIHSLPIAPGHIETLSHCGFRFISELFPLTPIDLSKECQISLEAAVNILEVAKKSETNSIPENSVSSSENGVAVLSQLQESQVFTAKDLIGRFSSTKPIITFCREIDVMLGGGIPVGQITEICGVPGIGKTQLAMQLSLTVQIPDAFNSPDGRCIYIDTEGSFIPERAYDMATEMSLHLKRLAQSNQQKMSQTTQRSLQETFQKQSYVAENILSPEYFLANILYYRCHSQAELSAVILQLKDSINPANATQQSNPNNKDVKLIIVDSIAFPFRTQVGDVTQRNRQLNFLLQTLNEIAFDYQVAVVLVNHMTTKIVKVPVNVATEEIILWKERHLFYQDEMTSRSSSGFTTYHKLVPALGEQFSHGITNRLLLHYDQMSQRSISSGFPALIERKATLLKSPSLPSKTVSFVISTKGIRDFSQHSNIQSQISQHSTISNSNYSNSNEIEKRQRVG